MSEVQNTVSDQQNIPTEEEQLLQNNDGNNVDVQAPDAAGDANKADAANADATKTPNDIEESPPKVDNKKTPMKRTPKRLTFNERAQKESEELVRNMGGSLELEGGRRTRSSARGSTRSPGVVTPSPPAKKARTTPSSGTGSAKKATPSRSRVRGRKIDIAEPAEDEVAEQTPKEEDKEKLPKQDTSTVEEQNEANQDHKKVDDADIVTTTASETLEKKDVKHEIEATSAETGENIENPEKEKGVDVAVEEAEKAPEAEEATSASADQADAILSQIPEGTEENKDDGKEEIIDTISAVEVPKPLKEPPKPVDSPQEDSPMETQEVSAEEESVAEHIKEVEEVKTMETPIGQTVSQNETVNALPTAAADELSSILVEDSNSNALSTPEPMEVDSSSKSEDATDDITAVSKITDPMEEADDNATSLISAPAVIDQEPTSNEEEQLEEEKKEVVPQTEAASLQIQNNSFIAPSEDFVAPKNEIAGTELHRSSNNVSANAEAEDGVLVNSNTFSENADNKTNVVNIDCDESSEDVMFAAVGNDNEKSMNDVCGSAITSPVMNVNNTDNSEEGMP